MEKIARNDPCPCGSGKKYKHCHWGKEQEQQVVDQQPNPISFDVLISSFNSTSILKLLASLQLYPSNHSKTFRLEQMARQCMLEMQKGKKEKQNAYWEQLKEAIESYQDAIALEERPTAAFTENAVFAEGNYIVYPGSVYVTGTRILNELLECIFLMKNKLPDDYKKQVNDAAGLLLFLSNSAASEIQHSRNMYYESQDENIVLPEYEQAIELIEALSFSKEYISKICHLHHYNERIVEEFLMNTGDPELFNDDPDENIVNKKPLLAQADEIILYMPTSVVSSITDFIYRKAKDYNCYREVINLLHERQFDKSCAALIHMNWIRTDIELPEDPSQLPIEETVFQFDNQKLGYLCFIGKKLKQPAGIKKESVTGNPFMERMEQVTSYLTSLSKKQPYQVLSLFVISETGDDYLFAWPKASTDHLSLTLSYSDLDAISYADNANILTLWKFAKTYARTSDLFRIEAFGGTLDAYVAYEENDGSFLDPNKANPIGGSLFIPVGYSNDFLREIQAKRDEHAAIIFHKSQVGYVKVIRYKQYAPIYIEKESLVQERGKVFRLVIETYKMPIWITNYADQENNSFSKFVCEGVAFWLHKLKEYLRPIFEALHFIQFEIEVIVDKNTSTGIEKTQIVVDAISIEIKIEAPRIQLYVPAEFMQLVRRSDNYADKLLMEAVLNGIIEYVKEAKGTYLLTEGTVEGMIEEVLQPSGAKMFLFSDASLNVRLDERNLPPLRYIHESDVSYTLDNLVSYLPKDYQIPEKINGRPEKQKLCRIVVAALIKRIQEKIESFKGEMLLEWLIKMNEKYVQVREFREITIPAKIACFSDFESEVKELLHKGSGQIRAGQATRTLIEFVAANPPSGTKWPNFDDVEELLALIDQVISWGSEGDSIWKELSDAEMGLLPSGRIGTEESLHRKTLSSFAFAKTTSEVFQYQENWEKNYAGTATKKSSSTLEKLHKELNQALTVEFGISLDKLSTIVWIMVGEGFKNSKACTIIEEKDFYELIHEKAEDISDNEIKTCLDLLSLLNRKDIGNFQPDFPKEDIYPWRQKRALSYLNRPIAKLKNKEGTFFYYGYRHLVAYLDNLHYLLYEGKFPNPVSTELKAWLGSISSGKGNPFRERVREWFETETKFEVISFEVDISPTGHLKAERSYGDIDLMVIDHENNIIYAIECKNITGGKTIYEMWSEISAYLGKEAGDDDAKIIKHKNRNEWLQKNKEALKKFVPDPSSYTITSFVLCADEIPLTYLKMHELPLPVKSFVFLRKTGLLYLNDL